MIDTIWINCHQSNVSKRKNLFEFSINLEHILASSYLICICVKTNNPNLNWRIDFGESIDWIDLHLQHAIWFIATWEIFTFVIRNYYRSIVVFNWKPEGHAHKKAFAKRHAHKNLGRKFWRGPLKFRIYGKN